MAVAAPALPHQLPRELPEQRMVIHGVGWKDYVILRLEGRWS